jgi:hypothetical protein
MALPTSYTYEDAANYMQFSILRESASYLGWGDIKPYIPKKENVITVRDSVYPFNNGANIPILPSPIYIAAETNLTFASGRTVRTYYNLEVDGTELRINTAAGNGLPLIYGDTITLLETSEQLRVRNTYYDTISDEVLNNLGLTNMNQINSTNIFLFRMNCRVEILKRAMQTTAADYSYLSEGDGPTREQVYKQIRRLFQIEEARYYRLAAEELFILPSVNIPQESESRSSQVTIVW